MRKQKKKQNRVTYIVTAISSLAFAIYQLLLVPNNHHEKEYTDKQYKTTSATATNSLSGDCLSNLYQHTEPVIHLPKMAEQSQFLCFDGYVGRASYISKSNLYSAEYLTAARLNSKIERENTFHEESELPKGKRAELNDYRRSGFDRGHLAPSADMPTEKSQYESFSLANMVPQNSEHNRKTWSKIESKTRYITKKYGEVYVVTLPIYGDLNGNLPKQMKAIGDNQVYIPNYMAKGIYIPKTNQGIAIISPNDASYSVSVVSLNELDKAANITIFPNMSASVKSTIPSDLKREFESK